MEIYRKSIHNSLYTFNLKWVKFFLTIVMQSLSNDNPRHSVAPAPDTTNNLLFRVSSALFYYPVVVDRGQRNSENNICVNFNKFY
jgi:hypothetical protein